MMLKRLGWYTIPCSYLALLTLLMGLRPTPAIASTCPTEMETLTANLLADLPSYTNRVRQRSRTIAPNRPQTYMVLAGQADFDPLPVRGMDDSTRQVFFTTLDQRFTTRGASKHQDFYWLFLTQTPQGWYLNTLMSRWGGSTPNQEPDPPREVKHGAVGQAIQTWLIDCRAGTLRLTPPRSQPPHQPSPG